MNPARIAKCSDVVKNAGAKSEVLVKVEDLAPTVEAAELALVLELKQQGVDALTAMSEERFWQEAALRLVARGELHQAAVADDATSMHRNRYGEKPEPDPVADPAAAVKEFSEAASRAFLGTNPPLNPEPTPAVEPQEEPQHEHDQECCTFLGRFKGSDLYFCAEAPGTTLIARYGPDANYTSGLELIGKDERITEAARRATAWGLLSEAQPEPQAERKGLEWRFEGDVWVSVSWAGPAPWKIHPTFDGMFRPLNSAPFATLVEAQAWCQEQEAKLLAEQEGKPDD